MPRTFSDTPAQVDLMIAKWTAAGNDLEELTLDALRSLADRTDLSLQTVPERVPDEAKLSCSVAGGYRWNTTPPILIVAESMSRRRQQFTALHELGHHIQKTDLELGERVLKHRDAVNFEDSCCDGFAAKLLLPDDLVNGIVDPRGPTAADAVQLFEASNASRAAVAVRLAQLLKGPGVIAVLDEDSVVTFAAAHGDFFPPARRSVQSSNPLVQAAFGAARDKVVARTNSRILYRDGHLSDELYGQAAWADGRLFIVMVESSASWLSYSPPRLDTAQYPNSRWDQCEVCEEGFEVKVVCRTCGQPKCPRGHCGCTTAREITCTECFITKHTSQFPAGSSVCQECLP